MTLKDWWHKTKRMVLIILHCLLFATLGFFCSQYRYLEAHQERAGYEDSLIRAADIVRERGQSMKIEIDKPDRIKK